MIEQRDAASRLIGSFCLPGLEFLPSLGLERSACVLNLV